MGHARNERRVTSRAQTCFFTNTEALMSILTYDEVLELLSQQALEGSVTAAAALERVLRRATAPKKNRRWRMSSTDSSAPSKPVVEGPQRARRQEGGFMALCMESVENRTEYAPGTRVAAP